jgi:hypothetical protein
LCVVRCASQGLWVTTRSSSLSHWTGGGRPSKLDAQYAKGCDLYVTEMQPELVEISSGVQGVPPFLARYTIDTHHTPGYEAGYVANPNQPWTLVRWLIWGTCAARTWSTCAPERMVHVQ